MRAARFFHTLESGNPEATVRNTGPVFLAETPQTDSFAGMTKYYSMGIVFYNAGTSAIRPSQ